MFHVVNPSGNVQMHVTEKKKDELLKDGWKLVEEPEQAAEPQQGADPTVMYTTEPQQKTKGSKKGKKADE